MGCSLCIIIGMIVGAAVALLAAVLVTSERPEP